MNLYDLSDQIKKDGQQKAYDNAGCDGQIKIELPILDVDISGKPSEKRDF